MVASKKRAKRVAFRNSLFALRQKAKRQLIQAAGIPAAKSYSVRVWDKPPR